MARASAPEEWGKDCDSLFVPADELSVMAATTPGFSLVRSTCRTGVTSFYASDPAFYTCRDRWGLPAELKFKLSQRLHKFLGKL